MTPTEPINPDQDSRKSNSIDWTRIILYSLGLIIPAAIAISQDWIKIRSNKNEEINKDSVVINLDASKIDGNLVNGTGYNENPAYPNTISMHHLNNNPLARQDAGWYIDVPKEGTYNLIVQYASEGSLPTDLHVDDSRIESNLLSDDTQGNMRWVQQKSIHLDQGVHKSFRFVRPGGGGFPHIKAVKLKLN